MPSMAIGRGGRVELLGADVVDGKHDLGALLLRGLEDALRRVELVVLDEGLADRVALGLEEGVGHAAADHEGRGVLEEGLEHGDLGGDLGAADDGDEGLLRVRDDGLEVRRLPFP